MAEPSVEIVFPVPQSAAEILSPDALEFVAALAERYGARREALLKERRARQEVFDAGEKPGFIADTAWIRESDWQVAPPPAVLQDRRVEITGPTDRKMVINALNSGAKCFMADLEDAHSPVWKKTLDGQVNLRDAVQRSISYDDPNSGKQYRLNAQTAVLLVRPRGWHLPENGVHFNGQPISGALFDFGLFFFHNAKALCEADLGPFFYLAKIEHYKEAVLWNDIFSYSEGRFGLPAGSVRATVLIETLPAVFQMHEILHSLKNNIVGLNCGRWDYIFSYIKTFRAHAHRVLPERGLITMLVPFLRAYSRLLIRTCHQRGAHGMGGMAAQIPIRGDAEANERALSKVREDKERESGDGHDGTWVAHPGLVPIAMDVFDKLMTGPDQKSVLPEIADETGELLDVPTGEITPAGFDGNIRVALLYISAWLSGFGAVPINNLMEDVATAEISRSQLWQWVRYEAQLSDGTAVTAQFFRERLAKALSDIGNEGGEHLQDAAQLLENMTLAETLAEFLTLPAYKKLSPGL